MYLPPVCRYHTTMTSLKFKGDFISSAYPRHLSSWRFRCCYLLYRTKPNFCITNPWTTRSNKVTSLHTALRQLGALAERPAAGTLVDSILGVTWKLILITSKVVSICLDDKRCRPRVGGEALPTQRNVALLISINRFRSKIWRLCYFVVTEN